MAAFLRQSYPEVAARLAAEGVRYVRSPADNVLLSAYHLPPTTYCLLPHHPLQVRVLPEEYDPSSPIGKSWRASFNADTREEAEQAMRTQGLDWSWLEGGAVRTVTKPMAALVTHEGNGRCMGRCSSWLGVTCGASRCLSCWRLVTSCARWMHPHRSSALHDAPAVLTVTLGHAVAVSLSRSWSRQPQGRACLAASADGETKGRTLYGMWASCSCPKKAKSQKIKDHLDTVPTKLVTRPAPAL